MGLSGKDTYPISFNKLLHSKWKGFLVVCINFF
jgi:hypothetical protein